MKKELIKVTPHIFYLPGEEETDQPYLYYIKGDLYSVVVDAGNSREHVEVFYKAIQEKGLPLPKYTIITHWHWDHTFGLPYVHGKTIANQLTKEKLNQVATWKWTATDMKKREETGEDISFCNECICKVYPDLSTIKVCSVDIGIAEEMELDLGDVQLKLYPRDSTHSRDALFVYMPQEKALFVGDGDCEDHYDNHGEFDQKRLIVLKEFIEGIDFEQYFLGHEEPDNRQGVMEYLDSQIKK